MTGISHTTLCAILGIKCMKLVRTKPFLHNIKTHTKTFYKMYTKIIIAYRDWIIFIHIRHLFWFIFKYKKNMKDERKYIEKEVKIIYVVTKKWYNLLSLTNYMISINNCCYTFLCDIIKEINRKGSMYI